jgi:hypothetical protein
MQGLCLLKWCSRAGRSWKHWVCLLLQCLPAHTHKKILSHTHSLSHTHTLSLSLSLSSTDTHTHNTHTYTAAACISCSLPTSRPESACVCMCENTDTHTHTTQPLRCLFAIAPELFSRVCVCVFVFTAHARRLFC